ncbi:MAG: flavodoxin-dependent (E)-4-hydroxy-3-methylbut-2-enyl-diphosphate synthase [Rickettsiales bacterium]|jgi:(E)-4-hydroxy-3-methylbut-2-enyl-diphosphate synthase|nr:flavodoxin-dependent (E)-4-hydroxy-3-methylbut-2-enyl-diphosphate synthase [Rickettsiales bacterium]
MIERRKTRQIFVGDVPVGGGAPITIQSMTNAAPDDFDGTLRQINECADAGASIMRISVPNESAADVLRRIVPKSKVPIVADIHYDWRMGLLAADAGAACLRINPSNIGSAENVREVVAAAKANKCSIRIGVNAGSLEKDLLEKYGEPCGEAMVESALLQSRALEDAGFSDIKISVKSSDAKMTIEAYEKLAAKCDYPLHLGVTEAGGILDGSIKNAMALGHLLWSGIGDTLRVSLSGDPVDEARAGIKILKAYGLSSRGLNIVSCPTCSRKCIDVIKIANMLEEKYRDETRAASVAVMGCVVNRQEAGRVDVGVYGASAEDKTGMLVVGGRAPVPIPNDRIFARLCAEIDKVLANGN